MIALEVGLLWLNAVSNKVTSRDPILDIVLVVSISEVEMNKGGFSSKASVPLQRPDNNYLEGFYEDL